MNANKYKQGPKVLVASVRKAIKEVIVSGTEHTDSRIASSMRDVSQQRIST